MIYYFSSTRYGSETFTTYQGIDSAKAIELMTELGHTAIHQLTKEEYGTRANAQREEA